MSGATRTARRRRGARAGYVIERARRVRLVVHRTGQHTYAQLIDPQARVLVSASTLEREMREKFPAGSTISAASEVGKRLAFRAKEAALPGGCAFDRRGFKYHGRVKAVAEGARAGGMEF